MEDIQNIHETQVCLELIHEAYSIMAKGKGLYPVPLYHEFMVGNQHVRQYNQAWIDALNKYMLTKGFNEGFKPLWNMQIVHNKIVNEKI